MESIPTYAREKNLGILLLYLVLLDGTQILNEPPYMGWNYSVVMPIYIFYHHRLNCQMIHSHGGEVLVHEKWKSIGMVEFLLSFAYQSLVII